MYPCSLPHISDDDEHCLCELVDTTSIIVSLRGIVLLFYAVSPIGVADRGRAVCMYVSRIACLCAHMPANRPAGGPVGRSVLVCVAVYGFVSAFMGTYMYVWQYVCMCGGFAVFTCLS